MGIIVSTATLLSTLFRKIRQPKVIAEILGGILLGPTAFGRIPGFTEHIFPPDSIPFLSLTANIGLCLFLFLVGLEIEGAVIKRNARMSVTVALAGMVLPFGLGAGLSVPLYNTFIHPDTPDVKFTYFMLFAGVAFSITAFPVLCRILTELRLLDTTVGIVVLSAGVGNDIIGWTLLALSVALVNAGSGLTALYILLCCIGFTLFMLFPIKRLLHFLALQTGSLESSGPSMLFVTITLLGVFSSSFFTDVIGVHAIFGAFIFGLIVPREGGLAIAMTEKLEDLVGCVFLPLYFTLSGLSTDLGLLDTGLVWAYTVGICVLAFLGKFGGCTVAARWVAGFGWREASAIGALMSCKGLVELIVLNVGLSAGILTPRVFSMFVLEALLLTFMTTPLVTVLYPPNKRVRVSKTGANFNNVPDGAAEAEAVEHHHQRHQHQGNDAETAIGGGGGKKAGLGLGFKKRFQKLRKGLGVGVDSSSSSSSSDETSSLGKNHHHPWGWGVVGNGDEKGLLSTRKTNLVVVLDRIEHVPGMMAVTQLLKDSLVGVGGAQATQAQVAAAPTQGQGQAQGVKDEEEKEMTPEPALPVLPTSGAEVGGSATPSTPGQQQQQSESIPTTSSSSPIPPPAYPTTPGAIAAPGADATPAPAVHFSSPITAPTPTGGLLPPFVPPYTTTSATISALRLIELTDRTSAVMKSFWPKLSSGDLDPLVMIYRAFVEIIDLGYGAVYGYGGGGIGGGIGGGLGIGRGGGVKVQSQVSIEAWDEMAGAVVDYAQEVFNEEGDGTNEGGMVLVPWAMPVSYHHHHHHHHHGQHGQQTPGFGSSNANTPGIGFSGLYNPFDALFKSANSGSGGGGGDSAAAAATEATTPTGGGSSGGNGGGAGSHSLHAQFIRNVMARCREKVDVGVYLDLGHGAPGGGGGGGGGALSAGVVQPSPFALGGVGGGLDAVTTVFLPFFGGPDDRLALDFVAQMCESERVRAVVVRITKKEQDDYEGVEVPEEAHLHPDVMMREREVVNMTTVASNIHGFPDTVYGAHNTETRLQSETADNIAWARYVSPTAENNASNSASKAALSRMSFREVGSSIPLHVVVTEARRVLDPSSSSTTQQQQQAPTTMTPRTKKLIVVTGRSRRMAVENHTLELKKMMEEYRAMEKSGQTFMGRTAAHLGWEVRKTIGDVAAACVIAGAGEGVVVVQAAEDLDR
ncbi:hypothetical protein K435DRAFT_79376 [Dendrothele bispora CBS 962.96]|uniref:Cation/H+ exchanger transmembrane domain-containing protein n=1 Tax=Dendrothele bispora (strain CBS 962.96) TaxID=1314807 RepID=A0A4S8M485_DENBC|nr:hypothetical protein K435DRAFT_79376 [Dendrothele bispora CBS 962.96]